MKSIVLFDEAEAAEVELLQLPPYVMVPASFELKMYLGLVSLPGDGTAVTSANVGPVVSTTKVFTDSALLVLLALSVTLMVQLYVVSLNAVELSDCVRMTVLSPDVADEDELPQPPEYVMTPASVEEKV